MDTHHHFHPHLTAILSMTVMYEVIHIEITGTDIEAAEVEVTIEVEVVTLLMIFGLTITIGNRILHMSFANVECRGHRRRRMNSSCSIEGPTRRRKSNIAECLLPGITITTTPNTTEIDPTASTELPV